MQEETIHCTDHTDHTLFELRPLSNVVFIQQRARGSSGLASDRRHPSRMRCLRNVTVGYMVYPMSQIYQVTMYTISESLKLLDRNSNKTSSHGCCCLTTRK
jgi:hypothetical protein